MMLYEKLFKTVVFINIHAHFCLFDFPSECNCLGIQNKFVGLSVGVSRSSAILHCCACPTLPLFMLKSSAVYLRYM